MGRHKTLQILLIFFLTVNKGHVLCVSSHYYSRYTASWVEAKKDCEYIGGFLVKLDDAAELLYLTSRRAKMALPHGYIWTGLSDINVNDYRWTDGSPLTFNNKWSHGQPDSTQEDCIHIHTNGLLNDISCNLLHSFICEVDTDSELAWSRADVRSCYVANDLIRPVRDAESYDKVVCPRNKIYFSPSHWKNFMTWSQADAYCKLGNGNLAKITSGDEQLMVDKFRKVKGFVNNYWTGGRVDSASGGLYTWVDGKPIGGNGGWPSFVTTAEPAADPAKNCIATGGTGEWHVVDCNTLYPILCEIDVNLLPNQQSCYWKLAPGYISDHHQQCGHQGGNLANIRTIQHYERMLKLVGSLDVSLGMTDSQRTWDFRLTDGSIMMWSHWYGNTEPNGASEVYCEYRPAYPGYNDVGNDNRNEGLCEKQVFQFQNADILHADGTITVTCHEHCSFQDGSASRTWTCANINVADAAEGCICHDRTWIILEPWLDHLNTSLIQDSDHDTCITPGTTKQVMTLSSNKTYYGYFETEVVLSADNEHLRSDIIRVFTSTDLSSPGTTCQLSGPLSRCKHVSGPKFACMCSRPCHVYVKVFQPDERMLPLTVCELVVI